MARKKKFRRSRSFTIPLAPVMGLVSGLAEPVSHMIADPSPQSVMYSLNDIGARYTGYNAINKNFSLDALASGLLPLVIGGVVHKVVGGKLGINAMLGRAGVPIIRI